jgi:hypothetical protein
MTSNECGKRNTFSDQSNNDTPKSKKSKLNTTKEKELNHMTPEKRKQLLLNPQQKEMLEIIENLYGNEETRNRCPKIVLIEKIYNTMVDNILLNNKAVCQKGFPWLLNLFFPERSTYFSCDSKQRDIFKKIMKERNLQRNKHYYDSIRNHDDDLYTERKQEETCHGKSRFLQSLHVKEMPSSETVPHRIQIIQQQQQQLPNSQDDIMNFGLDKFGEDFKFVEPLLDSPKFEEWENIDLDLDLDEDFSDFDQSFDLIGEQPMVVTYNCSTKKWDTYEFRPSSKPCLLICLNYSLAGKYDSINVKEYRVDTSVVPTELTLCDDFIQTCVLKNSKTQFVNLCIECNKLSQEECIMKALEKTTKLVRSKKFRNHQVQIFMPWGVPYSTKLANSFNSYFDIWSKHKKLRVICAFDNEDLDKSPKRTIPAGLQHHIKINVGTKDQHNTLLANPEMAIFTRIDLALDGSSASNATYRAYHYLLDHPDATRESCQNESLKKSPYSHKLVEAHPNFISPQLIYVISFVVSLIFAAIIGFLSSTWLGFALWFMMILVNALTKEWLEKQYEKLWKFYCDFRDTQLGANPSGELSPRTRADLFHLLMGLLTPIVVAGFLVGIFGMLLVCFVIAGFLLAIVICVLGICSSFILMVYHMDFLSPRPLTIYTSRIESMNYGTGENPLWNGTLSVMSVEIACNSWFYGFAYHLRNNSIRSCMSVSEIYISVTNMTRNDLWALQEEISHYQTVVPHWYLNHRVDTVQDKDQHIYSHLQLLADRIQGRATITMEKSVHYLRFFAGPQVLMDIGISSGIMEYESSSMYPPRMWQYSDWDTSLPFWFEKATLLQRSSSRND